MTHVKVASPVLRVMDIVRGGCPSILTDISTITDIWEDVLFDAVGAILGVVVKLDVNRSRFFFARCCLGKIPDGAPFSQLHKGGKQSRVDRP